MNYSQQFLPVRGIVNARELGGYVVKDGMVVKDRMLIRTAHLAGATDEDLQFLSGIPVTKIIDFRMETEKQGTADRMFSCAAYVALPVDGSGNAAAEMTEEEKKKFTGQKKFEIKQFVVFAAFNEKAQKIALGMYPTLLFNPECQRQFARFFRQVLDTENGAVLYHCSQGKDRTGIASCLLLAALGADKETIVADFDATNKVYERDVKKYCRRVRLLGGKEDEIAVVKSILGCNTEIFVKTLDRIDREYGSMEAYLKGPMGLTDEDIRILRQRYLERMP